MFQPMNLTENYKRWQKVIDNANAPVIKEMYRKKVTAQLLENLANELKVERSQAISRTLNEAAPTNNISGGNIGTWDPILISIVRRSLPNLMAYDVCGVQPMSGPTGLIFAMKSRYVTQTGTEALFHEADTSFSGNNAVQNLSGQQTTSAVGGTDPFGGSYGIGRGMTTGQAETLGDGTNGNNFPEMAFSIDKVSVTAKSRALKAEYTMEIAQDLKAVHGLDAENELANILSTEILTEINREIVRTLYYIAVQGAVGTNTSGTFDLDIDSDGRWSVERFKGLIYQLERDANQIAKKTRRGKGNILICSSDVASALVMAGLLDYTPALSTGLDVDDTGNTFAGVLNGKMKVYIDPYFISSGSDELALVGYKGVNPYDAGFFYAPYVPLTMMRAVGEQSFQQKIGFKSRYGLVSNPFYTDANGSITAQSNDYYRLIKVQNLL